MNVSPCQVFLICYGRFFTSWVGVTCSPDAAAAAAEQGGKPAGSWGLSMFGMGVGRCGVGVAGTEDLAVVAGADVSMSAPP